MLKLMKSVKKYVSFEELKSTEQPAVVTDNTSLQKHKAFEKTIKGFYSNKDKSS